MNQFECRLIGASWALLTIGTYQSMIGNQFGHNVVVYVIAARYARVPSICPLTATLTASLASYFFLPCTIINHILSAE